MDIFHGRHGVAGGPAAVDPVVGHDDQCRDDADHPGHHQNFDQRETPAGSPVVPHRYSPPGSPFRKPCPYRSILNVTSFILKVNSFHGKKLKKNRKMRLFFFFRPEKVVSMRIS
ncbi:hypothetical protein SDC9_157298 [bioreactor metagenome]|uniref:Uncharacterized protein n=1 Tax=bioreactor metagenome TaxID=1076179 RepID=A0A645F6L0_9ZZZZ